jgi:8-oxo-dGTP pyrophosphatase MutT (NUDIX family)
MNWADTLQKLVTDRDDFRFEDERHFNASDIAHIPAAVLIAITDRPDPGIILTQRPDWLRNHAGQVAFPGGKIDAGDRDPIEAALREAEEEIDLPREMVQVIGTSDVYYSGSGFQITPVLGIIPADIQLTPNPDEVIDWFEVPLDFLLHSSNIAQKSAIWQGQPRDYYEILWNERRIWGVTAGIIANLARRLS